MKFFDAIYEALGMTVVSESMRENETQIVEENTAQTEEKEAPYRAEEVKPSSMNYRPKTFEGYQGQENAKRQAKLAIKKLKILGQMPHFLISGWKGTGKSTLAGIVANELNAKMNYYISGTFTIEILMKFLVNQQTDPQLNVLFLDETHSISQEVAEFLYVVLEDFILPDGTGRKLSPFLFMGATTEKNALVKKFSPLVDRCPTDIVLQKPKTEDLIAILKQANEKCYQKNITEEAYRILAENCRYTPRVALSSLADLVVCEDINEVLQARRIITKSLTDTDLAVLEHLEEVGKPVGVEALSIVSGQSREDYQLIYEPFLIIEGLLSRCSRGRIITSKAKKLLEELKKIQK